MVGHNAASRLVQRLQLANRRGVEPVSAHEERPIAIETLQWVLPMALGAMKVIRRELLTHRLKIDRVKSRDILWPPGRIVIVVGAAGQAEL